MGTDSTTFVPARVPEAVLAEFTVALGSVLPEPVTTAPAGSPPSGDGWTVLVRVAGGAQGTCTFWTSQPGAAAVTRQVMALDEEPEMSAIGDLLKEMWTQAASALTLTAPYTAIKLTVGEATPAAAPAGVSGFDLRVGDVVLGTVGLMGRIEALEAAAPGPAPAPASLVRSATTGTSATSAPADSARLDVVLDIDLPLIVRFGQAEMTLKALTDLGPGSIVDMSRSPDDPVELLVGGQVVARGQVVIVAGDYGVRITDLVSRTERAHAIEV